MLRFFRKIRQNLLSEGKTGKYFKYALGEIVLVVIGILIALQINSWNRYHYERKLEQSILSEIRDNLKYDLNDFDDNITHLRNMSISSKNLLQALENNITYNDSLGFYFSYLNMYPHFSSKTNGYKFLLSKGFEIVVNDDLRNKITNLYEDRYQYLLTFEKERIEYNLVLLEESLKPYKGNNKLPLDLKPNLLNLTESGRVMLEIGSFRNIRDYEKLKEDLDTQSMIKNVEIWSTVLVLIHNSVKEDVLKLIAQIEHELIK